MKKLYTLSLFLVALTTFSQTNAGITGNVGGVYINEIHYDNASGDVGEFIEVAGPAGTNLTGYTITLYNGSATSLASYDTKQLSGIIDNEVGGFGAVSFTYPADGIQNGAPDGICLSNGGTIVQFISYEGTFTAVGGPAAGLLSADIIALQVAAPIGSSLEYNEATSSWINTSDDTPGDFAQGPLNVKQNDISGLNIHPNPVIGNVLYINTAANEIKNVVIVDILGKQVINTTTSGNSINVSDLNSGIYIVKVTEEGKTATRKLVIQ